MSPLTLKRQAEHTKREVGKVREGKKEASRRRKQWYVRRMDKKAFHLNLFRFSDFHFGQRRCVTHWERTEQRLF